MLINDYKEGQKKYKQSIVCYITLTKRDRKSIKVNSMLIHFNEEGQKKQYKQLLKTGKQYKTVTCN